MPINYKTNITMMFAISLTTVVSNRLELYNKANPFNKGYSESRALSVPDGVSNPSKCEWQI